MKTIGVFLRGLMACMLLSMLAALPARADTNMGLYKSFSGNINFAGTQISLRDRAANANTCTVSGDTVSQKATLTLPTNAKVVSAQLYWAGSGNSADTRVSMNSKTVDAGAGRVWSSTTIGGGLNYFSAAADVTQAVKDKGAGSYTFSGLAVSNGSTWCSRSAVLGGFALVVVYSHTDETYRTLNLYEGFRYMLNSEVRLDMSNFRVPDNVSASAIGRFAHLVWEGDPDISQQGESVTIYNYALTQSTYGPSGNNFNSKSSINNDTNSPGIDFDAYSANGFPAKLNAISAVFRTGGDMVLLNAAVLAVPSTPEADLSIALTRSAELRPGTAATYTATVTNNGPGTEAGPVKVSLALPTGLTYASGSGTNWSCTGSGATANCTYNGALATGARAPALTFKANVASNATGEKTATATVTGNNDPVASNNTGSEKGTVVTSSSTGTTAYVFTSRACKVGEVLGDTCPLFEGPVVAGTTPTVFVTAVDGANKARAVATTQSTVTVPMALGCVNPAGPGTVKATLAPASGTTATLPACSPDATVATSNPTNTAIWNSTSVTFPANQTSVPYAFNYLDAGSVKLYASTTGSAPVRNAAQFVSMPAGLKLTVKNAQNQLNPGSIGLNQDGFVRAGEPFTIAVEALSSGGVVLPSFGKETGDERPTLVNSLERLDANISGAVDKLDVAELKGDYPESGSFTGSAFSWSDVGSFKLGVALGDYLGETANAVGSQNVGRFYPAAFKTVAGAAFDCMPHMNCPSVGQAAVSGAVYSGQPFDATIIALDENGAELPNFDNTRYPKLVPTLTLQAVDEPGDGKSFGTLYKPGFADTPAATTARKVTFGLGTPYSTAAPGEGRQAPDAVYLRATAPDRRMGTALTVSSVQSVVGESEEGGVVVVSGRLAIDNVIGSELLKTPIPMTAQYWTGKNWENNTGLKDEGLLSTGQAGFSNCSNSLCDAQLVKPAQSGALDMAGGKASYPLAPIGAGKFGKIRIKMNTPAWLPSMFGQITIGAHKSPVIYIREMY